MAWLGVLFTLLLGFELAVEVSPGTARILRWSGWVIWALFLLEFAGKLAIAPSPRRFLRRHWLQALALLVPTLRMLRVFRLVRLGRALPAARVASSSYRSFGTARRLARSRIAYLGAVTTVITIAIAQLVYVLERGNDERVFGNFGDTVLWAAGVVLGQQGDPVPTTVGGRIVMNLGFVLGLTVMAALAGTLGAWFVDSRREQWEKQRAGDEPPP